MKISEFVAFLLPFKKSKFMNYGYVNKILPFSSVDGIGNRTVIFLQGCNFNCLYCHNPETIKFCCNCGKCFAVCKNAALKFENSKIIYIKENCIECDKCINICKFYSSPKVSKTSVNQIFEIVEQTRNFISGITISGGECTFQFEFLKAILLEANQKNISIFLDTNANLEFEKMKQISQFFDKSMIDIKWFDDSVHQELTRKSNKLVLKNADYLLQNQKVYEIRTVLFPYLKNHAI